MSQRKCFTFSVKRAIIQAIDEGQKKAEVAKKFKIPFSTLSTIYKQKDGILSLTENDFSFDSRKKKRTADYPELEKLLLEWLVECRNKHIPIGGDLVKEKAKGVAVSMGLKDFKGSDGWLGRFKKRHQIVFKKICSESAKAYETTCLEWENELIYWIKNYEPKNIFAAGEIGLFFKCLPHHIACFKNEKCLDGKHSKERVTLLLATNMYGSEKLPPLMIGKSEKPKHFKHINTFPVPYRWNDKAWITSDIFVDWLQELDSYMNLQERHILLFVDNSTAHLEPPLNNIKIVYFPHNCTPKSQPLTSGIVDNFKSLYRKEVVKNILNLYLENGFVDESKITILTAMRMIDKAWNNVDELLIEGCFKRCGFAAKYDEIPIEKVDVSDIPEWSAFQEINQISISFQQYVNFDDKIATANRSNADKSSQNVEEETDDEVNNEEIIKAVSFHEAKIMLNKLRFYFENQNVEANIFQVLNMIDNKLDETNLQNEDNYRFFH